MKIVKLFSFAKDAINDRWNKGIVRIQRPILDFSLSNVTTVQSCLILYDHDWTIIACSEAPLAIDPS